MEDCGGALQSCDTFRHLRPPQFAARQGSEAGRCPPQARQGVAPRWCRWCQDSEAGRCRTATLRMQCTSMQS